MKNYKALVKERFYSEVFDENGVPKSYELHMAYLWVEGGPADYLVEDEMLEYLLDNPAVTVIEAEKYFQEITPDGYPPTWTEEDIREFEEED